MGRRPAILTEDAADALLAHDWPGNDRELRNVLERATILSEGSPITTEHLSLSARRTSTDTATTDLRQIERQAIEQMLEKTRGNKAKAALRLGLTRTQLYARLRRHGLLERLGDA